MTEHCPSDNNMNIFVFSERYNNGLGILLNGNIEWMHSDLYHYFGSCCSLVLCNTDCSHNFSLLIKGNKEHWCI